MVNVTNQHVTPSNLSVQNATLTSFNPLSGINPLGSLGGVLDFNSVGSDLSKGIISGFGNWFTGALGLPSLKDALQRLGLILLGIVLVIVGLVLLTKGPALQIIQDSAKVAEESPVKLCRTVLSRMVTALIE